MLFHFLSLLSASKYGLKNDLEKEQQGSFHLDAPRKMYKNKRDPNSIPNSSFAIRCDCVT